MKRWNFTLYFSNAIIFNTNPMCLCMMHIFISQPFFVNWATLICFCIEIEEFMKERSWYMLDYSLSCRKTGRGMSLEPLDQQLQTHSMCWQPIVIHLCTWLKNTYFMFSLELPFKIFHIFNVFNISKELKKFKNG